MTTPTPQQQPKPGLDYDFGAFDRQAKRNNLSPAEVNRLLLGEIHIQLGYACRTGREQPAATDPRPHVQIALACADRLSIPHEDCYRYLLACMAMSHKQFWTFATNEERQLWGVALRELPAWLIGEPLLPEPVTPTPEAVAAWCAEQASRWPAAVVKPVVTPEALEKMNAVLAADMAATGKMLADLEAATPPAPPKPARRRGRPPTVKP